MRQALWILSLTCVVAAAAGCPSKSESKVSGEVTPTDGSAIGADQMGTFVCTDLKADVCLSPKDVFPATAPVIHVTYKTKDLPKNGDVYVIKWIAEDVGTAAPPNSVVATLNETVADARPDLLNYVVNSKLSKPTAGWPVGKYRVEISHVDKLVTTARFSVE